MEYVNATLRTFPLWTLFSLELSLDGVAFVMDYLSLLPVCYISLVLFPSTDAGLPPDYWNVSQLAIALTMTAILTICLNMSPKVNVPIDLPIVLSIGLLLMVTLPWQAFLFIYPPAVNGIAVSKDIFGFNVGSNMGNCLYLTVASASVHFLHLHWRVVIGLMIYWFFRPLMVACYTDAGLNEVLKFANTGRVNIRSKIWLRYSQLDCLLIGHYIVYAIYYPMFGHHGAIPFYYYFHCFCKAYQFLGQSALLSVLFTAGSMTLYIVLGFIVKLFLVS